MCQTDEIHESFYDLFNQRFNVIDDPKTKERHFYANIAIGAHSKPCRVDPNFRCVVVVKEDDLEATPAPFLNRFEKYRLSHETIYDQVLCELPNCLANLIKCAKQKVCNFLE